LITLGIFPSNLHYANFAICHTIALIQAKPFYGHFDLGSEIGKPAVRVEPGHNDTIKFTTNEWNKVKGWVKHNDDPEPAAKLPLIDLKTFTGGVKLFVHKQDP